MKTQEPVTFSQTHFFHTVSWLQSREWPVAIDAKRNETCIEHAASTISLLRRHGIECEIEEKILPAFDTHDDQRVHTTQFWAPREANTLADKPLLLAELSVWTKRARFVELKLSAEQAEVVCCALLEQAAVVYQNVLDSRAQEDEGLTPDYSAEDRGALLARYDELRTLGEQVRAQLAGGAL